MSLLITKENYEKEVTSNKKPVIIDVFADWCGPCVQMAPIFEELEKELTDYAFVKLNVDESRELAIQFGVTSIPTFIFMNKGKVMGKDTGYISKADLKKKIIDLLG